MLACWLDGSPVVCCAIAMGIVCLSLMAVCLSHGSTCADLCVAYCTENIALHGVTAQLNLTRSFCGQQLLLYSVRWGILVVYKAAAVARTVYSAAHSV